MRRDLHEQNRRSWNHATRAHNSHKVDQAGFFRGGGSTLFPEEIALLGEIAGLGIAHLQCNAGQDTLSLAALGASLVGVDISDEAVDFGNALSRDSGIAAEFVRSDVYDWLEETQDRFDVVFCSYGWLGWLSDLPRWAGGVARVLKPGGRFVAIEFHPLAFAFGENGRVAYPVIDPEPLLVPEGIGDYVGQAEGALSPSGHAQGETFENPEKTWEFCHGVGDLLTALLGAGLRIEHFAEQPFSNGCNVLAGLCIEDEDRRFWPPPQMRGIPLMFTVAASID